MERIGEFDYDYNSQFIFDRLSPPLETSYVRFQYLEINGRNFAKILFLDENKNVLEDSCLIVSNEKKIKEIEEIEKVYPRSLKQ